MATDSEVSTSYVIDYHRTMTVDADEEMSVNELRKLALDSLHDESALWNVTIEGTTYRLDPLKEEG